MCFTTWRSQRAPLTRYSRVSGCQRFSHYGWEHQVGISIDRLLYYSYNLFPLSPAPPVEKLNAISTLLEAFGNSRTVMNTNATRFTQMFSLDFDHAGQIASASVQVGRRAQ